MSQHLYDMITKPHWFGSGFHPQNSINRQCASTSDYNTISKPSENHVGLHNNINHDCVSISDEETVAAIKVLDNTLANIPKSYTTFVLGTTYVELARNNINVSKIIQLLSDKSIEFICTSKSDNHTINDGVFGVVIHRLSMQNYKALVCDMKLANAKGKLQSVLPNVKFELTICNEYKH